MVAAAAAAELKESLRKLLAAADGLRVKTAGSVVEILCAGQAAGFLAATAGSGMHSEMRRKGGHGWPAGRLDGGVVAGCEAGLREE